MYQSQQNLVFMGVLLVRSEAEDAGSGNELDMLTTFTQDWPSDLYGEIRIRRQQHARTNGCYNN